MSTINEVAARAGVSPSTVSHVMNQTRFVSSDVSERVWNAIRELNYQPNALARSLRRGKTHTIGLIIPDSANPFFAEMGRFIEGTAFRRGYSVIFCNTEGDPEREDFYLNVLLKKRVDGIILVSGGMPPERYEELKVQKLPFVVVDNANEELSIDSVLTDNCSGGKIATRHLIGVGRRRIACITGPSDTTPSAQRVDGYRSTLIEAGLPIDESLIVKGDFHANSGWKAGLELLARSDRPDAIFACNDMMAIGVLRAAAEAGLRVPEELSLVGFDDIDLAAYTAPPLTTVSQDKSKIGEIAVNLLLEKSNNSEITFRREFLKPVLVVRKSCGAKS